MRALSSPAPRQSRGKLPDAACFCITETCLSLQPSWEAAAAAQRGGVGWGTKKKHQRRAASQGIKDVTQASEIYMRGDVLSLPHLSDYAWKALTWLLACHSRAFSHCQPTHS